ncbi:MAG: twin-arginine translocase subunit TatC [Phycisphaeraceae bacterium]|nr:twin-arginine translocase subunit TatC [Phycisphaeraceae bacterium]
MSPPSHGVMSIGDHLQELRRRLILGLLGVAATSIFTLWYGTEIFGWLCQPLLKILAEKGLPPQINFFSVGGAFGVYMKISLVGGLVLGSPWLIYQLWQFVSAGLYEGERRIVLILAPFSAAMMLLGLVFMYWAMLPVCIRFFVYFVDEYPALSTLLPSTTQQGSMVNLVIEGNQYIGFVAWVTLGVVVGFQLPVLMLMAGWARLVDAALLARYRKYCVFACFCLGAVLTPADLVSMFVLSLPLWALFEVGLILMRMVSKNRGPLRWQTQSADQREPPDAGDP